METTGALKSEYIEEILGEGQTKTVYEAGPIKVEASCGDDSDGGLCSSNAVCLVLTLFDANEDLQVFGDIDSDQNIDDCGVVDNVLPKGTVYKQIMWDVIRSSGNDDAEGGVWANGYYLGWSGESFLGLNRDGSELTVIGGGAECALAGVFNYVVPEDEE